MAKRKINACIPDYQGLEWIRDGLPTRAEKWQKGKAKSINKDRDNHHALADALSRAVTNKRWKWPKRTIYFIADPHADAEAFNASLVASGGIKKTGRGQHDYKLTKSGRKAIFVLGGDCLDKGPSNLKMLDSLQHLRKSGARIKHLTGNHDARLVMGLRALKAKSHPTTEHMFIRMTPKVIPLLKEVHDKYLTGKKSLMDIPGSRTCRRRMYPSKRWFKEFPKHAVWSMPTQTIEREVTRMHKKVEGFEKDCRAAGLSVREVYASALKCRELFLHPKGEYFWFFDEMRLFYQAGSFLFLHAGLDDRVLKIAKDEGLPHLNRLFRKQIKQDLFEFYYGPLANTVRTKYRPVNMPLTRQGVKRAHRLGINAVVHGHRNLYHGQRIMLRKGLIHIESDVTMDRNSRKKEGLDGYGAGVTIIRPQGQIIGISTDYPYAKVFEPEKLIT